MTAWQSQEVRFASDHPTAAGHFPSAPIIPGVLVLDEAIQLAFPQAKPDEQIVVRAAKFHRAVRPGDAVVVRWQHQLPRAVRFECRLADGEALVASGTLEAVALR